MNIYTYYEDVGFKKQPELLKLWSKSWTNNGFNPLILSRTDAKKCEIYNEYYEFIQRVHLSVSNKELPENGYWLAAQLEIAAFTTIDCPSYISDYDIINRNFSDISSVSNILHWRNGCCSCFASGDGQSWLKYLTFIMSQEEDIINWCIGEKARTKRTEFGDQDFLVAIHQLGLDKNIFTMSTTQSICGKYFPNEKIKQSIYHISHQNMYEITIKDINYKDHNQDDLRVEIAKKIINDDHDISGP